MVLDAHDVVTLISPRQYQYITNIVIKHLKKSNQDKNYIKWSPALKRIKIRLKNLVVQEHRFMVDRYRRLGLVRDLTYTVNNYKCAIVFKLMHPLKYLPVIALRWCQESVKFT